MIIIDSILLAVFTPVGSVWTYVPIGSIFPVLCPNRKINPTQRFVGFVDYFLTV